MILLDKIKILDCTLRDGGYVNNWEFKENNIINIIDKLIQSNVDIIECGFINKNVKFDKNNTRYNSFFDLKKIIDLDEKANFVVMINFGDFDIDCVPESKETIINGIRVTFLKNQIDEVAIYASELKQKGYDVYMQPMVTMNYSEKELEYLIDISNIINPYALYIVDSFGSMYKEDVEKLFFLMDKNLNPQITIGFHSHNNMQLSYSNCTTFEQLKSERNKIIDSSVYGMGRGAGNLNTELIFDYMNRKNFNYDILPIIKLIDEVIIYIYNKNYFGYSLPYFISAKNNVHPNYATYLVEKQTLEIADISNILKSIDDENKMRFNKDFIEKLYNFYQNKEMQEDVSINELEKTFFGKEIFLVAQNQLQKIDIDENAIIVAINFIPEDVNADYIFFSNRKRFSRAKLNPENNCIITTNIETNNLKVRNMYKVSYESLLNSYGYDIKDNAGLMAIKLFANLGVKKINLVRFTGYHKLDTNKYTNNEVSALNEKRKNTEFNKLFMLALEDFRKIVDIEIIGDSLYNNYESGSYVER